jgi:MFS family permease
VSYVRFLRAEPRFLGFGFAMAFFASFGQTFFIALFSAELREAFGLSHGGFGTVYSLATLTSAALVVWLGRLIDHADLRLYAGLVCAGMVLACGAMAGAPAGSVVFLYLAILLLRLFGQGLMSHVSTTTMARYFEATRGRALAIARVGASAGEAIFPLVTVMLVAALGWRWTWGAVGLLLAAVLVPLILWLLRGHGDRHADFLRGLERADPDAALRRDWTRREVLRDGFFYLILPFVLAQSFIITGLFFHQVHLVESKGWALAVFAGSYGVYAGFTLAALVVTGHLVDRLGGERLLTLVLLPLAAGLLVLASQDAPEAAFVYMALAGLSAGGFGVAVNAFYAEAYGLRHHGAIRALVASLMVLSSAGSPAAMGWLIDLGVSMETICLLCLGYIVAATALLLVALRARSGLPGRGAGAGA